MVEPNIPSLTDFNSSPQGVPVGTPSSASEGHIDIPNVEDFNNFNPNSKLDYGLSSSNNLSLVPSDFDFNLKIDNNERLDARLQSSSDQLGNWFAQSLFGEVIGGGISAIGTIPELPIAMATELAGGDADFNNSLIELGDQITANTKKAFPIKQLDPGKSFDVGDFGWWANNGVSMASTLSLMIPGWGVSKGLGKVGEMMGLLENVGKNARLLGKSAAMAVTMRNAENFKDSLQTVNNIKEEALNDFYKMNDAQFEEFKNNSTDEEFKGKTREELASHIAAKSGWKNYVDDIPNIAFDFFQSYGLYKGLMNLGKKAASTSVLEAEAGIEGKTLSTLDKIKANVKSYHGYVTEPLSEGVEELVNAVAQNEGMHYGQYLLGKKEEGDFNERFSDYMNDPQTWEQAFWGVIGGAVFSGLGHAKNSIAEKYYDHKDPYANNIRIAEINSRKIQMEALGKQVDEINKGFYPGTNGSQKIEGATPEETDRIKKELYYDTVDRAVSQMTTVANTHGNRELLGNYLKSDNFRQGINELGISDENTDVQELTAHIGGAFNDTNKSYDYYNTKVFNGAKTPDYIRQILTNKSVEYDRFRRSAERRIRNIDKESANLRANDSSFLSESHTNNAGLNDDLIQEASYDNAIKAINEELKKVSDRREGKIAAKVAQDKINELKDKKKEISERIDQYAKDNNIPKGEINKFLPTSSFDLSRLGAEKLLNELALNQILEINKGNAANQEEISNEIGEELKKAVEKKDNDEFNHFKNVVDNTNSIEELSDLLDKFESGEMSIKTPSYSMTSKELKKENKQKVRKLIENKIKSVQNTTNIRNLRNNVPNVKTSAPQQTKSEPVFDISEEPYYEEAIATKESFDAVKPQIANFSDNWIEQQLGNLIPNVAEAEALLDKSHLLHPETPVEREAMDFYVKTYNDIIKYLEDIQQQRGLKAVTQTSKSNTKQDVIPTEEESTLNSLFNSFFNSAESKGIDFSKHLSVTLDLLTEITKAFNVNPGEELSFERILAYLYTRPQLGPFAVYHGLYDLKQAYLWGLGHKDSNGNSLYTKPNDEDVSIIDFNYIANKYGKTEDTPDTEDLSNILDTNIFIHDGTQIERDEETGDFVATKEASPNLDFIYNKLSVGDAVTIEIDADNTDKKYGYAANKDDANNIPLRIISSTGERIGYINRIVEGGALESFGIRYLGQGNDLSDVLLSKMERLETLWKYLQGYTNVDIDIDPQDSKQAGEFLAELVNVNRSEENKIGENSQLFDDAITHILRVITYGSDPKNGLAPFDEEKIKESILRWKNVVERDLTNARKIRGVIGTNTNSKIQQVVKSISTGSAIFAYEESDQSRRINKRLTDIVPNKKNIILAHTGAKATETLPYTIDGTKLRNRALITGKTSGKTYQGLYMYLPTPRKEGGKVLYMPIPVSNNTIGSDIYDKTSQQTDFSNKLASYITDRINDSLEELRKGTRDFKEVEDDLRKYIIVDKAHFKIQAGKSKREIRFVMFDEDGKGHKVKIELRKTSQTLYIDNESWNSRNDVADYERNLIRAVRGLKRNVALDEGQKKLRYQLQGNTKFKDFRGIEHNSYKDFLLDTDAVITNLGRLVSDKGKLIGYTNPRGARPLTISIGLKEDSKLIAETKVNTKFPKSGKIAEFATQNYLDGKYGFLYELADVSDIKLKQDIINDSVRFGIYHKGNIQLTSRWNETNPQEKSFQLSHEIIHGIIDKALTKKEYSVFIDDLKKFYSTIKDQGLKDEKVKHIFEYIEKNISKNEGIFEELITYGLTNLDLANFLNSIKVEGVNNTSTTAWGQLKKIITDILNSIAKEFGIKTKLDELNEILDRNVNIEGKETTTKSNPFADLKSNNPSLGLDIKLESVFSSNYKAKESQFASSSIYLTPNFSPDEEKHAIEDLISTVFLKVKSKLQDTTLKSAVSDYSKSVKGEIWRVIKEESIGRFESMNEDQVKFVMKALQELDKPDSLLWDKAKTYIDNVYGYRIRDVYDFTNLIGLLEIPEQWDDIKQFDTPLSETINSLVADTIYQIPLVDLSKTKIDNNEISYEVDYNTPSGFARMLKFEEVFPYLVEHLHTVHNREELLDTLFELGDIHDKSLWVLWSKLKNNTNLLNAFYSSFDIQIPERSQILFEPQDSLVKVRTEIGNKSAFRQYEKADEWITNIKTIIDGEAFTDEMNDQYLIAFRDLANKARRRDTQELSDIISNLFNLFGIDLTPKEIKYYLDDPKNLAPYIDESSMSAEQNAFVSMIGDKFVDELKYLHSYVLKNDSSIAFDQFKKTADLANLTSKFRYYKGTQSSINVSNNLVYSPIKSNWLSNWFKIKGTKEFTDLLLQHRDVPKMAYSNWLWNTSNDSKTPNGFLNNERGTIVPNTKFMERFTYDLFDGRKNLTTNEGQEYSDTYDNLNKLLFYIIEQNNGLTKFELFNADKGHTYYVSGIHIKHNSRGVKRTDQVWKAIHNTLRQEIATIENAFDKTFETYIDEKGQRVYKESDEGVEIKSEAYRHLVKNKHLGKGDLTQVKNGRLLGRAFQFTGMNITKRSGEEIDNLTFDRWLETKGINLFDEKGLFTLDIVPAIEDYMNEFVDLFIKDLVDKNIEENDVHKTFLENGIDFKGNDLLGNYNNFEAFVTEFALNSYINNVEHKNFFGGNNDEVKDNLDYSKRADQITRTKHNYYSGATSNRPDGTFNAVVLPSVSLKGTIYENIKDDAKFAKPYQNINTTDGQSYITLDEFEERSQRNGTYDQYKKLIDYLRDPNAAPNYDIGQKLQSQKHFYYDYRFDDYLKEFVSEQVKNQEFILVDKFVKGTDLEKINDWAVKNNVHQIDFNDSVKLGERNYFSEDYYTIENGRLILDEGALEDGINVRKYSGLGVQQVVKDHIEDEKIKLGVQIAKIITNNIFEARSYNVSDNSFTGKDLFNHYQSLQVAQIKDSVKSLLPKLGISELHDLNDYLEGLTDQDKKDGIDPATLLNSIKDKFEAVIDKEKVYQILLEETKKRTNNVNSVFGNMIDPDSDIGETYMPIYWSSANKQNINILAALFTNNVTTQDFPGIHATLVSGTFFDVHENNEESNVNLFGVKYIDKVAKRDNKRLRMSTLEGGKVLKAEVLLPAWSSNFYQNNQRININDLSEELRTMVGFRIPTEAKHSMIVFEVVGFLPTEMGSTVIVPDDYMVQSGADYDIDSLYILRKNFKANSERVSKDWQSQEFINFVKKELLKDFTDNAGNQIKFDYNNIVKTYIDDLESDENKAKLIDRINKAHFNSDRKKTDSFAIYSADQVDADGKPVVDYYEEIDADEALADIAGNENVVELAVLKSAIQAYNQFFKKNPKFNVTFEEHKYQDTDNDSLYKAKVEELVKSQYGREIARKLNIASYDLVNGELIFLAEADRNSIIQELIKQGILPTLEQFKNWNIEDKNTRQARENRILDIYKGILLNRKHFKEMTNAIEAKFDDTKASRNRIEQLTGRRLNQVNPNRPEDAERLKQTNLRIRALKGASIAIDGFMGIAQRTKMYLRDDLAPIIKYEDITQDRFEREIFPKYGKDAEYDADKNTVTIKHRFLYSSPLGDDTNFDGDLITSIAAQASANILDAVRETLPPNVDLYTIGLWKLFPNVGVGHKWLYASSFVNQPVIVDIATKHKLVNSVTYIGNERGKEIEAVKRQYQTELFKLISEQEESKGEISFDKFNTANASYVDSIKEEGSIRILRGNINQVLGYNPDIAIAFSLRELDNMIKAYHENDGKFKKGEVTQGINFYRQQLRLLEMFNDRYKKAAEGVTDAANIFNVDKSQVGGHTDTTDDLTKRINEFEDRILIDGEVASKAIYPVLFGSDKVSAYPALQAFLYYSNVMAYGTISQFDIRETAQYKKFMKGFSPKAKDAVFSYIMGYLTNDLPFFRAKKAERAKILGVANEDYKIDALLSTKNKKNAAKFSKLSAANQVYLLKERYKNGKEYGDKRYTVFDYLEAPINKESRERYGYEVINFKYSGNDLNTFIAEIDDMWNSDDEFLKEFVKSLIRYSYYTNGLAYSYTGLSKLIPVHILSAKQDKDFNGIGYADLLRERFNQLKNPNDTFLSDELQRHTHQAMWRDENVVPIAQNRLKPIWKDGKKELDSNGKVMMGVDARYPIYNPLDNGIIKVSKSTFSLETDRILKSNFVRVRKYNKKLTMTMSSPGMFSKVVEGEKGQTTRIKSKNDYKVGDIINVTNDGWNEYRGVNYKNKDGQWFTYGSPKMHPVNNPDLINRLNTEFENPIKFVPIQITEIIEDSGKNIYDKIVNLRLDDAHFDREGYSGATDSERDSNRALHLARLKQMGVPDADEARIIKFTKIGDVTSSMRSNLDSDIVYERYERLDSDYVYFMPVSKLMKYEYDDVSVIDRNNTQENREHYISLIEQDAFTGRDTKEEQNRDERIPIGKINHPSISIAAGENASYLYGVYFIENGSREYRPRTELNARQSDLTIAFAKDFTTAGEILTKSVAGGNFTSDDPKNKYSPISLDPNTKLDINGIVEKINRLGASTINIAGNGIYTLGQYKISQTMLDRFIYRTLQLILTNPNLAVKVDTIITGGQTGADEAGAKAAKALGLETYVRMPKDFLAKRNAKKNILGNESLDRFSDDKAPMYSVFSSTEPGMPVEENDQKEYDELQSDMERINNLIKFLKDNKANFRSRAKATRGYTEVPLKEVNEELDAVDFDALKEFNIIELKEALLSTIKYYRTSLGIAKQKLSYYDNQIDFDDLLNSKEDKTRFMNVMKSTNDFIRGFSTIRNIELLSNNLDFVNEEIAVLKSLESAISTLDSTYNRILKRYWEKELGKYTTNPDIKAGLRKLFDPQRDMNWAEVWVDSLGDTENSFLANLYKKYIVAMIQADEDIKTETRAFQKIWDRFRGAATPEEATKRFIKDYIVKDKEGNPTGTLITRYDRIKFDEEKKKVANEVSDLRKKGMWKQAAAKWREWYAKNEVTDELDSEGRTVEQVIEIKKAELTKNEFRLWRLANLKYEKNKKSDGGKFRFKGRPSDKYFNPNFDKIKDEELYKYLVEKIPSFVSFYKGTTLKEGMLPAMPTPQGKSFWDNLVSKIGWFDRKNNFIVGENDEIIRFIPIDFVHALSQEDPVRKPKPMARESYENYVIRALDHANSQGKGFFTTLQEIDDYNKNVSSMNAKKHGSLIDYNMGNVMPSFINSILKYKHKKGIESELLVAKNYLDKLEVLRKDGKGLPILNKIKTELFDEPQYTITTGKESNLKRRFEKFLEMVFYEDFELDEGKWQKLARVLQNYTSANNMWLNFTGAFNNVLMGNTQIFMETYSKYFWDRKDSNAAEKDVWRGTIDRISNINSEESDTLEGAIMKKFDITQLQDERSDPDKNILHKHLLSTNAFYIMHHMGEYYMQNKGLLAMIHSHRINNGNIVSFVEFKQDNRNSALRSLLSENDQIKLDSYLKAKYEEFRLHPHKLGKDHLRDFILDLKDDNIKNKYVDKVKELDNSAKEEFNKLTKVRDIFELKDGIAQIKEDTQLNENQYELFVNKIEHVNQKIHGIYNKTDAGMIQNTALGRLGIQFRKWLRPGWSKRFGSKFGSEFWNEQRNEKDKGSYISFWDFFTKPIGDNLGKEVNDGHYITLKAVQNIFRDYVKFITNMRVYWGTLDDFEKANVRRAISELLTLTGVVLLGSMINALRGKKGDDDDDQYALNLAMYLQDRLKTDLIAYMPIAWSGGWINEGKKLLRSPFAGFGTIEDLTKLVLYTFAYPFQDEEHRVYQSGSYRGDSKLENAFKRAVQIVRQYKKMERIEDYVSYYKLFNMSY